MSDVINTVIDKKAFDQLVQLQQELDKSHKQFLAFAGDVSSRSINFSKIKLPADLERELKQITAGTEQLTASLKEQDKTERNLITAIERKKIATESTAKALTQQRVDIQQINKENKRQAVLSSELTGEYQKQSTILNILRDRYKDMVLTQKGGTAEAEKMKNEIQELDKRLKAVDATVGQHQRNVGNYSLAVADLHPGLGRLDGALRSMGTSLDDIATGPDPFNNLATSAKNFGKSVLMFMISPVGLLLTALGGLFLLIKGNKDTVIQFDSQLIDVGKTTGITGKELQDLGKSIIGLSKDLKTVGTPALMEYAKVAGQLGVKGTANILAFTEALAKLETASNIKGEEGGANIARLLTLTDGGVQNVKDFGDEIVILGNNFAATENEILGNATAIAQNTAQYGFGRRNVLAYATATKAVGVEAELTGSTIGRTLGIMEKSLRTGQNVEVLTRLTGKSVSELKDQFQNDTAGVFTEFVKGLNDINKAGGSVNEQLENMGIVAVRDQRVIGSLASKGYDTLTDAIEKTGKAAGSLDSEFGAATQKLENQLSRVGIAWDNLILSIENGQGALGRFFSYFAGKIADTIDGLTRLQRSYREAMAEGKSTGQKTILEDLKRDVDEFGGSVQDAAKYKLPGLLEQLNGYKVKLGDLKKEQQSASRWITAWATVDGLSLNSRIEKTGELIARYEEMARIAKEVAAGEGEWFDFQSGEMTSTSDNKGRGDTIDSLQAEIAALEEQRDSTADTRKEVDEYNASITELQKKLEALQGVQGKGSKDAEKERLELLKKTAKEEFDLAQQRIKNAVEAEKEIVGKKDGDTDLRLEANQRMTEKALDLLELEKDYAIKTAEGRTVEIQRINEQYEADRLKLIEDNEEKVKEIFADSFKEKIKTFTEMQEADARNLEEEVLNLKRSMLDKGATHEEIEIAVKDLRRKSLEKQLQDQIDYALKELEVAAITADERAEVEKRLLELKKDLLDQEFDAKKEYAEKEKELNRDLQDSKEELQQRGMDLAADVVNGIFDKEVQKYDDRIQANDDYYERLFDNELMSDEQRAQLEAERDKTNEQLEKKKAETARKAFLVEQGVKVAQIAIDTIQKVAAIKATMAVLLSNPVTIPLAPLAAAQIPFVIGAGALATGTVMAQTIPAFAKGKNASDPYEGPMVWGEKQPEVKMDKYGNIEVATKPTLGETKKGDTIFPSIPAFVDSPTYEQIVNASIMASLGGERNVAPEAFDHQLLLQQLRSDINQGIKEGFANMKIETNVHNNNSGLTRELKLSRLADV